jgi:hypothetical protein
MVLFFLALAIFSSLVAFAPDDSKAVNKAGYSCVAGSCRNLPAPARVFDPGH